MTDKIFKQLASLAMDVSQIRSSAMQPLLWLIGVVLGLFFLSAYLMQDYRGQLIQATVAIAVCLIVFCCGVFLYFLFKDPDRLQSEQYQIKRAQILQQLRQSSSGFEQIEADKTIENPKITDSQGGPHETL